ncbi:response regulator [Geothrix sp. 21YS21S-4]|uniref:response regulator n=1 Tax=Geothrix sp. 21YS21S-4 TaxID=3068889 RepID=UPI0027BA9B8D|nr:response regulator [Geothrix sp. 21YS21S-4]
MLRSAATLVVVLSAAYLWAAPQRTVRVAVFPHMPAIFLSPRGEAQGFYVDMLRDVARRKGWGLVFVPGTWQEGLERARAGEVDLLPGVARSPEGDAGLDYGKAASYTVWSILYARPGAEIRTILDVRDRRIGVVRGDVNGDHFRDLCARFNLPCALIEFYTFDDVLGAVSAGRVDGGVTSSTFGYSQEGRFLAERTAVVFAPFDTYFAVAKGRNPDLLAALDAYLTEGKGSPDSGYQRAINRWLAPQGRSLPPWVRRAGFAVLALLALATTMALAFRRRVRRATEEIRELNRGLERELGERRRVEERILNVASGVSAATGETFLHELTAYLARATGADLAFIAESVFEEGRWRMKALAVSLEDGKPGEAFDYEPEGTPCELTARGELCIYPSGVQEAFPTCAPLRHMGAQSYVGSPLLDSQGKSRGVLAVLHRTPLTAPNEVASLLRIFSARATAELERRSSEGARAVLERQMQHAQKLESLGVLAGGIAHDFNNLLTAMLGHLNVAQVKLAPESPARPHLESLERIIHRAADLTRQMLAYSGKGRFVVRSYDLNHVVKEVTHLLEVSIPKKITLRFQLAPDLPPVEADAAQIQQVIMNLVTNAADAIGETEGTIRLSTAVMEADRGYLDQILHGSDLPTGTYATLEVSDTGCGMPPEIQARIFEPFFTTKVTGRGLGLSATVGILKGHRAGMRIYSEPGGGTTFKLLFPITDVKTEEEDTPAPPPALARNVTVLLVDDEEMIRDSAAAALRSIGLSVVTASNGREAVDAVLREDRKVDLILMDLTMPHMDGREAFRAIRRHRPDLPVILTSGYNAQESIQDFLGRGLAAFLQKPFTVRALEQTVLDVLAKHRPA